MTKKRNNKRVVDVSIDFKPKLNDSISKKGDAQNLGDLNIQMLKKASAHLDDIDYFQKQILKAEHLAFEIKKRQDPNIIQ